MPGIAGIVNVGGTVDTKAQLHQMLEELKHEDFHSATSFYDKPFGLGIVQLGFELYFHQPIFSRDQKRCIVIRGEIYNKKNASNNLSEIVPEKELEAVLDLYLEYDVDFINFLKGSFSLAIIDFENKRLIIANDRYGLFPIYFATFGDIFLFSSEIKSILTLKSFPRILDHRSLADFFSFGYILGNRTFFNDIKLLPPASVCIMDARKGKVEIKRYWDFSFQENNCISLEDIAETVSSLLQISVNKRIPKRPKPFGLGLSGGIDSRTILAHINSDHLSQIYAYTVGLKQGFDRKIAQKICRKMQISHHFFQLKAKDLCKSVEKVVNLTDGMWIFHNSFGTYPLYPELKKHFDVMLVGTAGELFHGGYLIPDVFGARDDEELTKILYRKANTLVTYAKQQKFFSNEYRNIVPYSCIDLQEEIAKAKNMSMANKTDYFFMQNRVRRFINLGLVHARNYFQDRLPFFDYDLMDYFITVPPHLRANNGVLQKIFSNNYPELGRIPLGRIGVYSIPLDRLVVSSHFQARIGSYLSKTWNNFSQTMQSLGSGKFRLIDPRPIVDYNYWYRTDLRDFVESILFDSETLTRPYFNHDCIAELFKAHMTGKKNLADILGALVTFELWHRLFFNQ